MLILLINTVLSPNGVHLFSLKKGKAECLAKKTWNKSASHSEKLLPAIESVFKKVKKTWSDLGAIFAVNGPGPFTSLRVGIAVANSAGFALKIPVYSVPNDVLSSHILSSHILSLRAHTVILSEAKNLNSFLTPQSNLSEYITSKIPEIAQKKAFQPIVPIYGREPNISKPRPRTKPFGKTQGRLRGVRLLF